LTLTDKLYRNQKNIVFCNSKGIRISGPKLGRPKKDEVIDKAQEYKDSGIRNAVEGKFGEGKTSYGLNRIKAKLKETSETVINLAFWVMNLNKRLRLLLHFFCLKIGLFKSGLFEDSLFNEN
jgi:IS5 family transposase